MGTLRGGEGAQFVWNPTEYLRLAKDPLGATAAMHGVEVWRMETRAAFHHDPDSQAAIDLEAHVRQLVLSFLNARPLPGDVALGNAVLTALAGTLGAVAAESVRSGRLSRDKLVGLVVGRMDAIIASEEGLDGRR